MKNAGLTEDGAKALVARWKFVESAGGPASVSRACEFAACVAVHR